MAAPQCDFGIWGNQNQFAGGMEGPFAAYYRSELGRTFGVRPVGSYGQMGGDGASWETPMIKSVSIANAACDSALPGRGFYSTNVKSYNTDTRTNDNPAQNLAKTIAGDNDVYLRAQVPDIHAVHGPVYVEPWSEMNIGNLNKNQPPALDGPWEDADGPGDAAARLRFRDWWRRVHDIIEDEFSDRGWTSNVIWVASLAGTGSSVWSDSGNNDAAVFLKPLLDYDPSLVDMIGVDAYSHDGQDKRPPELFNAALNYAKAHGKPLGIFETGHRPGAGKSDWYTDLAAYILANPEIGCLVLNQWEGQYPAEFCTAGSSGKNTTCYANFKTAANKPVFLVGGDTGTAPTISNITPKNGPVGTSVVITGTNFGGGSTVKFGGINATSYVINSATQITAVVPVAGNGAVTVVTPHGSVTSTGANLFAITPTISSFSPATGAEGTTVTVLGTGFTGATSVKFNGIAGTDVVVSNDGTVSAKVPAGSTTGKVTVATPGGTATSATNFTSTTGSSAPAIASFSPATGVVGSSVVITGSNFVGVTAVKFNGIDATSYVVNTATQITAVVPDLGGGLISVTNASGTGTSATSFGLDLGPTISSFSPTSAEVGDTVTIDGSHLALTTQVHFGDTVAAYVTRSGPQVTVLVPSGGDTGQLLLDTSNKGSVLSAGVFTVLTSGTAPTISSFSPDHDDPGATITIVGTGFTGASSVRFNGVETDFVVTNDTHIDADVPEGGSGLIEVTTAGGTATSADPFDTDAVITSIDPEEGVEGTVVTITGTGLLQTTGVTFGDIPASDFTIVSDTEVEATAPFGADGYIGITTVGGSDTSSALFDYTFPDPTEYSVTYYGTVPWTSVGHTFEIQAVVTSGDVDQVSLDNPVAVFTPQPKGIWLVDRTLADDENPAIEIQLLGQDDSPSEIGETSTQFFPVGRRDPITVTESVRGYEGTVSGIAQSLDDVAILETMKANSVSGSWVRLVMGTLNIPVVIGALNIGRHPTDPSLYPVSFAVTQIREFDTTLRI